MTKKNLVIFCCIHCLLWSLLPLMRNCVPMDTMEAVYWGNYLEWGNYKHPPFSGFVAKVFFDLLGGSDFSLYFLSQVCISVALIYIYRLVKKMTSENRAIQAVYLSTGILYFNILAIEFNTNVLSVSLWAMNSFYFYQAVQKNKTKHWILLGITAGLNVLTKYTGGVLLVGMGIFMLATKWGRQQLKHFGPYLTCMSCIIVLIPHLCWLVRYDFLPLRYIANRGGVIEIPFMYAHLIYPLKFIVSQLVNVAPVLVIYLLAYIKNKSSIKLYKEQYQFIGFVLIFPVVFMALTGGLLGVSMRAMWGTAMMFPVGICLVLLFPVKEQFSFEKVAYVLLILFSVVFIFSNEKRVREKVSLDSRQFAKDLTEQWHKEFNRPLKYVGGEVFYIAPLALYSSDKPTPIGDELDVNPWLNKQDIIKQGGIVLMECILENCEGMCEYFSPKQNYSATMLYKTTLKTKFGKTKQVKIHYCFMKPQGE